MNYSSPLGRSIQELVYRMQCDQMLEQKFAQLFALDAQKVATAVFTKK